VVLGWFLGGSRVVPGWFLGGFRVANCLHPHKVTHNKTCSVCLACLFVYSARLLFDTSHLSTHYWPLQQVLLIENVFQVQFPSSCKLICLLLGCHIADRWIRAFPGDHWPRPTYMALIKPHTNNITKILNHLVIKETNHKL